MKVWRKLSNDVDENINRILEGICKIDFKGEEKRTSEGDVAEGSGEFT